MTPKQGIRCKQLFFDEDILITRTDSSKLLYPSKYINCVPLVFDMIWKMAIKHYCNILYMNIRYVSQMFVYIPNSSADTPL